MSDRISYRKAAPGIPQAMMGLENYIHSQSGLDPVLLDLVRLRASQINGCAFCVDMHSKDLLAAGQSAQRVFMLDVWREAAIYSDRERAALAWTEAVTKLTDREVSDAVYDEACRQFSDAELANLTLAIIAINGWNRLNVAFRTPAGNYQPTAAHHS
ncbi:MAG TPA: carboxymuconolactone decarboxylase family protein [Ktedonobacterales bacterium]